MSRPRQLGLWSATALVVANMIGTGVFTTSGFLLGDLGSPLRVLSAWVIGGVVASLGALCYGALARRFPESGGEYLFLARTIHPAAGFLAGWVSLLVGFSAPVAAAAVAFGEYTKAWFPFLGPKWSGTALLVLFSWLHATGVRSGAGVQNLSVGLKLGLIAWFVGLGFSRLPAVQTETDSAFAISSFAVSLVWISFSYSGWNAAVYVAGEVRDPDRNLPRSLLLGTALVTLVYLALNALFVFAAPAADLAGKLEVGRIAAEALGGRLWAEAMTGLVALALVTSVSAMIMAGPRVYSKMAADGFLPTMLRPGNGPPRAAIAFQMLLAVAMVWSATYDRLLTYIGFTLGLSTAVTVAGLVALRLREGKKLPVPGWPVVPLAFIGAILWMTLFTMSQRPFECGIGLATLGAGLAAWKMQSRNSKNSSVASQRDTAEH